MCSTDSLDCQNLSAFKNFGTFPDWVFNIQFFAAFIDGHLWSAVAAAYCLAVIASVQRLFVLDKAVVAQRKIFHRGSNPVIGHAFDDGESRSAIGACIEGVLVASVLGISDFFKAFVTDCNVGWNHADARVGISAFDDFKIRMVFNVNFTYFHRIDFGYWGQFLRKPFNKIRCSVPLNNDFNNVSKVSDMSSEA